MLLSHGFAVESLHLYCTNLSKISGASPMSVIISYIQP